MKPQGPSIDKNDSADLQWSEPGALSKSKSEVEWSEPGSTSGFLADYSVLTYVSASSVQKLSKDTSSITPAISSEKVPGLSPGDYLSAESAMGYNGPLGPFGPLAGLGPIGDNSWNISYWINGIGDWSTWSESITKAGGPLSTEGPLGYHGPVAEVQYYGIDNPGRTLFETNDFAVHTRAMGVWSVLGPIGPLGALGPLGPLGPVGAHGFSSDSNGQYLYNGKVVRTITVSFDQNGTKRTYGLVEKYTESFAKTMSDNDTSFMVLGKSSSFSDIDSYSFNSSENQVVTITLIPEKGLDDFDIAVFDGENKLVATSNTLNMVEFIQLEVPAGKKLKVKVKCAASYHSLSSTYRLIVTGSTKYLNKINIRGNHILNWYDNRYQIGSF